MDIRYENLADRFQESASRFYRLPLDHKEFAWDDGGKVRNNILYTLLVVQKSGRGVCFLSTLGMERFGKGGIWERGWFGNLLRAGHRCATITGNGSVPAGMVYIFVRIRVRCCMIEFAIQRVLAIWEDKFCN